MSSASMNHGQSAESEFVVKLSPSLADIEAARRRISPYVRQTALEHSPQLSTITGSEVYLKLENQQRAGSFKPRISFSKLLAMDQGSRSRGVIASTAGGHGMGLSYAGSTLGVSVHIYLPHNADPAKVAFMKRQGATLTYFSTVEEARVAARERAAREQLTFISAYNDPFVIAGGGTVALEILDELPDLDLIIVGVGGGGIASGMGIALHSIRPTAQVWGVQPNNNAVLTEWLKQGRAVEGTYGTSIAEGLGAEIENDSITFPLAQQYVKHMLTVGDEEIKDAMAWLMREHNLIVEPSGAAPIAALMNFEPPLSGRKIALVITGGNINHQRYLQLVGSRINCGEAIR